MPAAAPAKKTAAKPSSSSSSKSTDRKTTARSSQKSTDDAKTAVGEAIEELRDKRASYDQPVVDSPVAVQSGGETETLEHRENDKKDNIVVTPQGSSVELSIGSQSVTLDGEGVRSLYRHLSKIVVGM